jgi:hypothetical protein
LFKKKRQQILPTTPTEYPDGVVVETESGRWYIKGRFRFLIPSDRIFYSWRFPTIIKSTDAALSKYLKNGKIGFRSGSFLYNTGDGCYYLISGNVARKISNPDVFATFGLDPRDATWVSEEELGIHKSGEVFK